MMMPLTKDAVISLSPEISSLKWGGERKEGPWPPGQQEVTFGSACANDDDHCRSSGGLGQGHPQAAGGKRSHILHILMVLEP